MSEPRILVFACNWCSYAGADMAGVSRLQMPPNCRVVRVMCSARVRPEQVLAALLRGLDGVLVLGCHPGDCHYAEGNYHTRRRALLLDGLLAALGLERQRFQLHWVSAAEGARFAETVRAAVEQIRRLGPNPLGRAAAPTPARTPLPTTAPRPLDGRSPDHDETSAALRQAAQQFLERPDALCFLGHEDAPLGRGTRPAVIRDAAQADHLVFNRDCHANLAAYLPRYREQQGIVGVAVKGCDARSLRELIRAGQIQRERLFVVGLPCDGLRGPDGNLDPRCHGCRYPAGLSYDLTLGPMESPDLPARIDAELQQLDQLTADERRRFWEAELAKCIRCDACRQACYGCFCPRCILDSSRPRWLSRRGGFAEKLLFHAVRALHLAGRCVGCDACARACPTGVRFDLLNRALARHLQQTLGYAGAGLGDEQPPLLTFSLDDPELSAEDA